MHLLVVTLTRQQLAYQNVYRAHQAIRGDNTVLEGGAGQEQRQGGRQGEARESWTNDVLNIFRSWF